MMFGMVAVIDPGVEEERVPITEGEAKLPLASDNSAVNTFPELKIMSEVKFTGVVTFAEGGT
jgi:hypothetical protein